MTMSGETIEKLSNDVSELKQFRDNFDEAVAAKLDPVAEELRGTIEALRAELARVEQAAAKAQATADSGVSKVESAQATANTAAKKADAAQSTANTAVKKADAAQKTANTGVSQADRALNRTLKVHMRSAVYRSNQTKTETWRLGKQILGVWWAPQDESHQLRWFAIGAGAGPAEPTIRGNEASVVVSGGGNGEATRILWCVLYEE